MAEQFGFLVDTINCVGCKACEVACKNRNELDSPGPRLRKVTSTESGTFPDVRVVHLSTSCMHCENPACERVCPTGATYKDDKGRVEIDYDKCIGCRMCMAACPYSARTFNWNEPVRATGASYGDARVPERGRGVMEKCTLCKERTDEGDEPMCVRCCPADARIFGDLDDPDSAVSRLRREQSAEVLLEEKGTRPQVFYVR